jgi:ABC-type transport system involved in multi-copper enzyme maturation permease subunit
MSGVLLIAGKEIRAAVRTLRFALVFIIVVALFLGAILLGANRYNLARQSYELTVRQQAESFGAVKTFDPMLGIFLSAYRLPNSGAIVAGGINQLIGDTFYLYNVNNPPSLKSPLIHNSFSRLHGDYDPLSVVAVIISFLALLLSYDAFSGEKRDGTISLLCAGIVGRTSIAIGKVLGLTVTIAIPIVLAAVASAVIIVFSIPGESSTVVPILGAMTLTAILYAAVLVALGTVVSALTHQPFRSLIATLIIWLVIVFMMPELATTTAISANRVPTEDENSGRYQEITIQYLEEFKKFPQDRIARRAAWFDLTKWYQEQLRLVWRDTANSLLRQEEFGWAWGWISPTMTLKLAVTALCGTNPASEVRSIESVWDTVLRYDDYLKTRIVTDMEKARDSGGGMPRYESGIPWAEIPQTKFLSSSFEERVSALAIGSLTLLCWLAVMLVLAILLARRYDPR